MDEEVKVTTKGTEPESNVGLEISGGPGMIRLLLTRPYERAAEIVEIPVDDIVSVTVVGLHPMGAAPESEQATSRSARPDHCSPGVPFRSSS